MLSGIFVGHCIENPMFVRIMCTNNHYHNSGMELNHLPWIYHFDNHKGGYHNIFGHEFNSD